MVHVGTRPANVAGQCFTIIWQPWDWHGWEPQGCAQVRVKRRGDDRKHVARVLAIGVECDMALLTVDEPEFWEGVQPVGFGPLPRLHVRLWGLGLAV